MDSGTRSSLLHAPKRTAWRILRHDDRRRRRPRADPLGRDRRAQRPSDSQIQDARQTADALSRRIAAFAGQISSAQAEVEDAQAASAIALDGYQATQAAYEAAQAKSTAAASAAAQATADLGVARDDVAAFARRSYMDGSTYAGAASLIAAAGPAELIERAALLEAAGSHRSDVLDEVTVLQEQAKRAEAVARTAVIEADQLKQQAADELAYAQSTEADARRQAAALSSRKAALTTQLASAQSQLRALVGAREAADRIARATPPAPKPVVRPSTPPVPDGNDTPAGDGSASAAQTAIDAAMRYLGTPYAWGGGGSDGPSRGFAQGADTVGFDCSGLTQYAYAQAGIYIPRNSRAQYSSLPKVAGRRPPGRRPRVLGDQPVQPGDDPPRRALHGQRPGGAGAADR